jgi:hypothetical protein
LVPSWEQAGAPSTDRPQQIYNVKATPSPPPGGLDLYIADDEEFSPDKLRANVERLYMTVGVGMLAAVKHVARLRSWRETQRTACFATAYFVAWIFDFLVPLLSAVLVALIGVPQIRGILFPPAPVALVDSKTGGVQKPQAGVLGSHDSATGAPEKHKGEAVEQEASSFVRGIASVAMGSAAGKHPQGVPDSDKTAAIDAAPDPTALATSTADAKDVASGGKTGAMQDKTKVPMETMMWNKMRPIMHTLGTIADTWERLAKYGSRHKQRNMTDADTETAPYPPSRSSPPESTVCDLSQSFSPLSLAPPSSSPPTSSSKSFPFSSASSSSATPSSPASSPGSTAPSPVGRSCSNRASTSCHHLPPC